MVNSVTSRSYRVTRGTALARVRDTDYMVTDHCH